jgi:hypothetical protein
VHGLIILSLSTTTSFAQVITKCGNSDGYAYYLPGAALPEEKAGWRKDGMSDGEIILIAKGDKPQIIFRDATNKTQDVETDHGAELRWLSRDEEGISTVLAVYPVGLIEHYVFRLDAGGKGEVVWGGARYRALIQKSSLYRASCTGP